MNFTDNGEGEILLSPSSWCESKEMLFHLVWGGHCYKYKVLVTGVKVICKKSAGNNYCKGEVCQDYFFILF